MLHMFGCVVIYNNMFCVQMCHINGSGVYLFTHIVCRIVIFIERPFHQMRINNVSEFLNFVNNNQLAGIAPEIVPFINCINEFNRMCSCDHPEARMSKQNQCRALYIGFATRANQYKNVLFTKTNDSTITFCVDGQSLITLNR
jgi:hypothetical protein